MWLVNPRHLEPAAVAKHRSRFRAHPHGVLVVDDFLVENVASMVWAFLDSEAVYTRRHLLFPGRMVAGEEWCRAPSAERFSRDDCLVGVLPERRMSPHALAFVRLRTALGSDAFVDVLRAMTGAELAGGMSADVGVVKRMRAGDFISPHDDLVEGRVLGVILHLTRGWAHDAGGELRLRRPAAGEAHVAPTREPLRETVVETGWNRAVILRAQPDLTHEVTPVDPDAGDRMRLTIGSWFR